MSSLAHQADQSRANSRNENTCYWHLFLTLVVCVATLLKGQGNVTAREASNASEQKPLSKFERFGHPRGPAPAGWPSLAWPEKRQVLFGMYAPTEEEVALIERAAPKQPIVPPKQPRKVLVFYQCQYPHASIATANVAYEKLADSGAFEVALTDDPAEISKENLAKYDALLLNNTTDFDVTVGESGQQAIIDFVRSGKGLVGVHAASDSCKRWPEGSRMIGGIFSCHPWLPKGTWAFELETPSHPLNQAIGGSGFWMRDEIYAYRPNTHSRERSRVLIGLDLSQQHNLESSDLHPKQKSLTKEEPKRPVAWIHRCGEGRVFYSNFGHNNTTDWGAHHVDIACWALREAGQSDTLVSIGGEAKFPVPYENGYPTLKDQYNTATSFSMTAKLADGTELVINSGGRNGVMFEGEKGRMFVNRGALQGKPVDQLADNPLPEDAIARTYKGLPTPYNQHKNHWANFFHCIRERVEPISDVTSHLRAIDICHLANIAARFGREMKWDASTETIIDDSAANALLAKEYRKGFEIES